MQRWPPRDGRLDRNDRSGFPSGHPSLEGPVISGLHGVAEETQSIGPARRHGDRRSGIWLRKGRVSRHEANISSHLSRMEPTAPSWGARIRTWTSRLQRAAGYRLRPCPIAPLPGESDVISSAAASARATNLTNRPFPAPSGSSVRASLPILDRGGLPGNHEPPCDEDDQPALATRPRDSSARRGARRVAARAGDARGYSLIEVLLVMSMMALDAGPLMPPLVESRAGHEPGRQLRVRPAERALAWTRWSARSGRPHDVLSSDPEPGADGCQPPGRRSTRSSTTARRCSSATYHECTRDRPQPGRRRRQQPSGRRHEPAQRRHRRDSGLQHGARPRMRRTT